MRYGGVEGHGGPKSALDTLAQDEQSSRTSVLLLRRPGKTDLSEPE